MRQQEIVKGITIQTEEGEGMRLDQIINKCMNGSLEILFYINFRLYLFSAVLFILLYLLIKYFLLQTLLAPGPRLFIVIRTLCILLRWVLDQKLKMLDSVGMLQKLPSLKLFHLEW